MGMFHFLCQIRVTDYSKYCFEYFEYSVIRVKVVFIHYTFSQAGLMGILANRHFGLHESIPENFSFITIFSDIYPKTITLYQQNPIWRLYNRYLQASRLLHSLCYRRFSLPLNAHALIM